MNGLKRRYASFVPVLLFFAAIDLWSKDWMSKHLEYGKPVPVIPGFFQLTLSHNTGMAWSIGAHWSMWFFIATSAAALAAIGYLFHRLRPDEKCSMWGLSLIMSGAVGNLADRIRLGYVVDFIDVFVGTHHWPVFNIADSAITVGAVLFGIDLLLKKQET